MTTRTALHATLALCLVLPALFPAAALRADEPKQPLPDAAARAKTLAEIKDLFKDDYAKKKATDLKDLAEKLLKQGGETKDDPATRFVLLAEAARIATIAGDQSTLGEALGTIETDYAVEGAIEVATTVCKAAQTTVSREAAVRRAVSVLELALAAGAFEPAEPLYDAAWATAKKAANRSIDAILEPFKEISQLKDEYGRLQPALVMLNAKPNDPPANFAVGKFKCYRLGNWKEGIPLLSKGSEPKLAALADRELNKPEPSEQGQIADGWWTVGEAEKGLSKHNVLRHALDLYRPVVDQLTGLPKARAEKRLEQNRAANSHIFNLLRTVNLIRDRVEGTWVLQNGVLITPADGINRIRLFRNPPRAYRLRLTVEPKTGSILYLGFIVEGRAGGVVLDGWPGDGYRSGLEVVDGRRANENETTVTGQLLPPGKKHEVVCDVRPGEVRVFVDTKPKFRWAGNPKSIAPHQDWAIPNPDTLFLGAHSAVFLISKAELEPLPLHDR